MLIFKYVYLFFFLRSHGKESCDLIGSQRCPYFLISSHEYTPTFIAIFHKYLVFSGWAVFLSEEVGHYLKPLNNEKDIMFLYKIKHNLLDVVRHVG